MVEMLQLQQPKINGVQILGWPIRSHMVGRDYYYVNNMGPGNIPSHVLGQCFRERGYDMFVCECFKRQSRERSLLQGSLKLARNCDEWWILGMTHSEWWISNIIIIKEATGLSVFYRAQMLMQSKFWENRRRTFSGCFKWEKNLFLAFFFHNLFSNTFSFYKDSKMQKGNYDQNFSLKNLVTP